MTRHLAKWGLALSAIVCALAGGLCAQASDAGLDISQYAHTAWKVRDGFTPSAIRDIAQTPDGYLWLATDSGLVRFDGVRAVPWQPPNGERLPSNSIRSLLVARDGTLWIATPKGLASWKDGQLRTYAEVAGQVLGRPVQADDGTVWFGAYPPARLCAARAGKVQCDGAGDFGLGVYRLLSDRRGNLWVASENGVWRWAPGTPEHYLSGMSVSTLFEDQNGEISVWANNGPMHFVGGNFQNYSLPGVAAKSKLAHFMRSRDGSLWMGGFQGLFHSYQGRIDTFGSADGLSGDVVGAIFEDPEGSVWVSTLEGLDRFRRYTIPRISKEQGLGSYVYALQATGDGAIWISTSGSLNRWAGGRMTAFGKSAADADRRTNESVLRGAVTEIANSGLAGTPRSLGLDDQGRLWVSTADGVFHSDGDRFTRVPGLTGGILYAALGDGRGKVWISGNAGLFHVTPGGEVESIPWAQLRHQGYGATALLRDRARGGLWLGFYEGGLVYFQDGQVRRSITATDGLGKGRVSHLRLGSRSGLWAATESGLSRVQDAHIETLSSKNGLPCDEVRWSMEDDDHNVWVYMPCGLARLDRSEWYAWVDDPRHIVKPTIYDNSDGVTNAEILGGYGPHVTKAPDGKIWFVTHDGVSVIDPRHLPHNQVPPPVHVEQVTADGNKYDPADLEKGALRLPPLVRNLEIDYTALSMAIPEKVRFRYKLEGQDKYWREVVNQRQVQYSNLGPKHYRFRVMACNNSGVWNEAGAFLDFSIAPAYYQTNWFRALCVAAFLAFLWASYQYRLHQIQREFNAGLEGRVNERTRIARELHDTLLQSFHGLMFQFQAARNLLPQKPERAMESLDSALMATERALAEGRDAIRDLRPEQVAQRDLAHLLTATGHELAANQQGDGHSASFRVIVEGEPKILSPMLQDEVYRIAREVLRNAFRHAAASSIEAEIRYDEQHLRLRIRDDGKGMDAKVLGGRGRPGHWGLAGIRERAQRIGARLDFWSQVGAGTEVELSVPAAMAYKKRQPSSRFGRWKDALKRQSTVDS